jgi:hypothetical protein
VIPLSTTSVRIDRPTSGGDPYDTATLSVVVAATPAHISAPSGRETQTGGQQETVDAVLLCAVADLSHYDLVTDLATDETWSVVWVRHRRGLGLDHMHAGLRAVHGGSSG